MFIYIYIYNIINIDSDKELTLEICLVARNIERRWEKDEGK